MGWEWSAKAPTLALVSALALGLAACGGGPGAPGAALAPTATNAPAGQGVAITPGTEEDFVVNVGRRTFFAEGSAALDGTATATLDKQVAWLQTYPSWKVKVQGFADDPGGDAQNLALSKKRAEAVRSYLAGKGIAPERLLAKGYGRDAQRLITGCSDLSCKVQNRRVISNVQEEFEP
jgi:peptidoglycan-associated lipoprotein